ncbi:MAG: rod shape-determining protein RodA, partial [Pseudomonadota bacterium]
MSYLEYQVKYVPSGFRKLLYLNWPIVFLITAVTGFGILMLYSVAGGSMDPWATAQAQRFGLGLALMMIIALVPI